MPHPFYMNLEYRQKGQKIVAICGRHNQKEPRKNIAVAFNVYYVSIHEQPNSKRIALIANIATSISLMIK